MGNEKLAAIRARTCIGHGENARTIVLEAGVHFIFEAVTGAATASSRGIAALDHELLDHAVEGDAIIVSPFGEIQKIRHSDRSLGWLQSGFDFTFVCAENNADVLHGGRVCR